MNAFDDHEEGLIVHDSFFTLYEGLIGLSMLTTGDWMTEAEIDLINTLVGVVEEHNEKWIDLVLGEELDYPDDHDDDFKEGAD
jgi:hypothetical protein